MGILSKSQLYEFRNSNRYIYKSVADSLNEFSNEAKNGKMTIFLSHKHDEVKELDSAISFLKKFGVNVYVDWMDGGMPNHTTGRTAIRIKDKIKQSNKFIFLATEGAINSKWCNWELGFGDSYKYMNNIAILPIRNDYENFTGSEYLHIYPSIEYVPSQTIRRTFLGGYFEEGGSWIKVEGY